MTLHPDPMTPAFSAPENDHERFLYSVSHDLQEPLRMVTSFLKLLESKAGDQLDGDAKRYLQYSVENADRMKHMIHALVDLSRVSRDTEAAQHVNLQEIAGELNCMMSSTARGRGAQLSAPDPIAVFMAPGQAIQLLSVLFQNAFDNQLDGQPLELKLTQRPADEKMVDIELEDNGAGMPEEFTKVAFDLFRKKERSTPNVGAGLAIARAIVGRYGGEIALNRSKTNGTVVSFRLPTTGG